MVFQLALPFELFYTLDSEKQDFIAFTRDVEIASWIYSPFGGLS
jgi:hypothetical protein